LQADITAPPPAQSASRAAPFSPQWLIAREYQLLAFILTLALIHGMIYVYTVLPWQHYDEPTNFEYAWMIANTGELPEPEVYDLAFRADLVRSMIEYGFYSGSTNPDPENLNPLPDGLKFPQLDDPPAYFILASLPLRLLQGEDMATQLRAARQVSVFLLVVTVLAAWGTVREVTSPESAWRFLVPLTLALLPGFVDMMTAVNNDVGAAAVFSLFLWGSVRLIERGLQPVNVLWVFAAAATGFFTKGTAYAAIPLALIAFVLGILPGRLRLTAWGVILIGGILAAIALLYNEEPAYWYRATTQPEPIRAEHPQAPVGSHVLQVSMPASVTPRWLLPIHQPLSFDLAALLAGRPLTFGYWAWADPALLTDGTLQIQTPILNTNSASLVSQVTLTGEPQFFAMHIRVPEDTYRIWLSLAPLGRESDRPQNVYFDGFVLAEGEFPLDIPPQFSAPDAANGVWDGAPFHNLWRNPSIEETWPAFRPTVDDYAARLLPNQMRPSMLLYTALDPDGAGAYYQATAGYFFQTFWGRFGWGHIPLPRENTAYPLLGVISALGLLGVLVYPYGQSRKLPLDTLVFLTFAALAVWGAAFARGAIYLFVDHIFIPSARYTYPAIIPTVFLLVAGWFALAGYLSRWLKIPPAWLYAAYAAGFLAFDGLALWGIVKFFASI
jgi:hypothetical protein